MRGQEVDDDDDDDDDDAPLQRLRQAELIDEKNVRVNRRQCKAGDTVQSSMSKPRGPTAKAKNKNNRKNSP